MILGTLRAGRSVHFRATRLARVRDRRLPSRAGWKHLMPDEESARSGRNVVARMRDSARTRSTTPGRHRVGNRSVLSIWTLMWFSLTLLPAHAEFKPLA